MFSVRFHYLTRQPSPPNVAPYCLIPGGAPDLSTQVLKVRIAAQYLADLAAWVMLEYNH